MSSASVQPEHKWITDGGTHYFSTHGGELVLETGSFSFPDFFLLGARA
jgi:hypothetical protein